MALHATQALEDAFDATKELLLPVQAGTWLRIAVMAFFIGGFTAPTFGPNVDVDGDPSDFPVEAFPEFGLSLAALVAIVAAVVLVGLVVLYVGSVMEFVLVETLRTGEASVRDRFRAFTGLGAHLFGFRLLLALVTLMLVGAIVAPAVFTGNFFWFLLLVPVTLFAFPVLAVVYGFTNVFVVPVMLDERCGVLKAWRRFVGAARAHLDEYGVYLLLSVVLSWIGGVLVAIVAGIIGVVLLLPIGLVTGFAFFTGSAVALVVLVPLLVLAILFLLAVGAVVRVPVLTYLRYYALFVLGGTTEYDLLAEVCAAITDEEDGTNAADPG